MNDFIRMIFMDYSTWQLVGYVFFMVLGIFSYSLLEVSNRDIKSKNTPVKFSFKFFYKDNIKRYIATVIILFIQFRFFKELTGTDLTEYTAFLLGFSSDSIIGMKKKNIGILKADRKKLIEKNG